MTEFDENKLDTLARMAKMIVDHGVGKLDEQLLKRMMTEGIRKYHDTATSRHGKGKFHGHVYWSKEALTVLEENKNCDGLTPEHAVPVSVVVDILLGSEISTKIDIYKDIIKRFSIVVIFTRKELKTDGGALPKSKMPEGWDGEDVWARYKVAKLMDRILDRSNLSNSDISSKRVGP